jgi:hypothetical protein
LDGETGVERPVDCLRGLGGEVPLRDGGGDEDEPEDEEVASLMDEEEDHVVEETHGELAFMNLESPGGLASVDRELEADSEWYRLSYDPATDDLTGSRYAGWIAAAGDALFRTVSGRREMFQNALFKVPIRVAESWVEEDCPGPDRISESGVLRRRADRILTVVRDWFVTIQAKRDEFVGIDEPGWEEAFSMDAKEALVLGGSVASGSADLVPHCSYYRSQPDTDISAANQAVWRLVTEGLVRFPIPKTRFGRNRNNARIPCYDLTWWDGSLVQFVSDSDPRRAVHAESKACAVADSARLVSLVKMLYYLESDGTKQWLDIPVYRIQSLLSTLIRHRHGIRRRFEAGTFTEMDWACLVSRLDDLWYAVDSEEDGMRSWVLVGTHMVQLPDQKLNALYVLDAAGEQFSRISLFSFQLIKDFVLKLKRLYRITALIERWPSTGNRRNFHSEEIVPSQTGSNSPVGELLRFLHGECNRLPPVEVVGGMYEVLSHAAYGGLGVVRFLKRTVIAMDFHSVTANQPWRRSESDGSEKGERATELVPDFRYVLGPGTVYVNSVTKGEATQVMVMCAEPQIVVATANVKVSGEVWHLVVPSTESRIWRVSEVLEPVYVLVSGTEFRYTTRDAVHGRHKDRRIRVGELVEVVRDVGIWATHVKRENADGVFEVPDVEVIKSRFWPRDRWHMPYLELTDATNIRMQLESQASRETQRLIAEGRDIVTGVGGEETSLVALGPNCLPVDGFMSVRASSCCVSETGNLRYSFEGLRGSGKSKSGVYPVAAGCLFNWAWLVHVCEVVSKALEIDFKPGALFRVMCGKRERDLGCAETDRLVWFDSSVELRVDGDRRQGAGWVCVRAGQRAKAKIRGVLWIVTASSDPCLTPAEVGPFELYAPWTTPLSGLRVCARSTHTLGGFDRVIPSGSDVVSGGIVELPDIEDMHVYSRGVICLGDLVTKDRHRANYGDELCALVRDTEDFAVRIDAPWVRMAGVVKIASPDVGRLLFEGETSTGLVRWQQDWHVLVLEQPMSAGLVFSVNGFVGVSVVVVGKGIERGTSVSAQVRGYLQKRKLEPVLASEAQDEGEGDVAPRRALLWGLKSGHSKQSASVPSPVQDSPCRGEAAASPRPSVKTPADRGAKALSEHQLRDRNAAKKVSPRRSIPQKRIVPNPIVNEVPVGHGIPGSAADGPSEVDEVYPDATECLFNLLEAGPLDVTPRPSWEMELPDGMYVGSGYMRLRGFSGRSQVAWSQCEEAMVARSARQITWSQQPLSMVRRTKTLNLVEAHARSVACGGRHGFREESLGSVEARWVPACARDGSPDSVLNEWLTWLCQDAAVNFEAIVNKAPRWENVPVTLNEVRYMPTFKGTEVHRIGVYQVRTIDGCGTVDAAEGVIRLPYLNTEENLIRFCYNHRWSITQFDVLFSGEFPAVSLDDVEEVLRGDKDDAAMAKVARVTTRQNAPAIYRAAVNDADMSALHAISGSRRADDVRAIITKGSRLRGVGKTVNVTLSNRDWTTGNAAVYLSKLKPALLPLGARPSVAGTVISFSLTSSQQIRSGQHWRSPGSIRGNLSCHGLAEAGLLVSVVAAAQKRGDFRVAPPVSKGVNVWRMCVDALFPEGRSILFPHLTLADVPTYISCGKVASRVGQLVVDQVCGTGTRDVRWLTGAVKPDDIAVEVRAVCARVMQWVSNAWKSAHRIDDSSGRLAAQILTVCLARWDEGGDRLVEILQSGSLAAGVQAPWHKAKEYTARVDRPDRECPEFVKWSEAWLKLPGHTAYYHDDGMARLFTNGTDPVQTLIRDDKGVVLAVLNWVDKGSSCPVAKGVMSPELFRKNASRAEYNLAAIGMGGIGKARGKGKGKQPDEKRIISLSRFDRQTETLRIPGGLGERNVKYCSDGARAHFHAAGDGKYALVALRGSEVTVLRTGTRDHLLASSADRDGDVEVIGPASKGSRQRSHQSEQPAGREEGCETWAGSPDTPDDGLLTCLQETPTRSRSDSRKRSKVTVVESVEEAGELPVRKEPDLGRQNKEFILGILADSNVPRLRTWQVYQMWLGKYHAHGLDEAYVSRALRELANCGKVTLSGEEWVLPRRAEESRKQKFVPVNVADLPNEMQIMEVMRNVAAPVPVRDVYLRSMGLDPSVSAITSQLKKSMNKILYRLAEDGQLQGSGGQWSIAN